MSSALRISTTLSAATGVRDRPPAMPSSVSGMDVLGSGDWVLISDIAFLVSAVCLRAILSREGMTCRQTDRREAFGQRSPGCVAKHGPLRFRGQPPRPPQNGDSRTCTGG